MVTIGVFVRVAVLRLHDPMQNKGKIPMAIPPIKEESATTRLINLCLPKDTAQDPYKGFQQIDEISSLVGGTGNSPEN